ncbi:Cse1-domain-containing protein [Lepidopterella palustris CBS 459.81]|uniref:Cse1-domain-containing protein n=1 Tax=Lepidopterella palustris CBS 459.81 TaxID=1314670 RepID=A0A8E2E9P6_9PEZI|nr:Cse1-domain-containing protein [Lepidopterella palustris CBS 459.81]
MAAPDVQAIAHLLELSLDPRQNKQAEAAIALESQKPGFSLTLLQIVASQTAPSTIRLASTLYFKNFIRRNWTDEDGNHKLPEDEVVAIKRELIGLMTSVPSNMQAQLGEAVSVIADSDFWERWDTLVDDLISRLTPDNATVNNGVLQVAHSIFKRWRPLFRSDALFTEINHVLSKFSTPFLTLMENTNSVIAKSQDNPAALKEAFTTWNLIMKLFYDLSCQDLPPVFEENLHGISSLLHKYLQYDNPALHTDDESESGVLEYVKAGIFEGLILYVQKYEDAFGPELGLFINSSWEFLTTVGLETKYDILVSRALQFLTSVARIPKHAQAFEQVLPDVIEKVILPNLSLRESDIELFEDEPIEFIRRDLEGSDSDTRRRAATDFLRQLMAQFETLVTNVVTTYLNHYLQNYASDRKNNWKSKDTAVYLFSAIAATGTATTTQGVMSINPNVSILDFFQNNIAEDLTTEGIEPILKVDAIKFVYIFRSQLTTQYWHLSFPLLVKHLGSNNYVVYTYSAIAVERALFMTDENRQPIIPKADVVGLSKDLLQHLFALIQKDSAPEKIQENEFLMKCVMRVLIFIRDGVLPITDLVLANFINITKVIRHNPSNPRFQYYHFEGIGALVRYAATSQHEKLEKALYEPFVAIVQEDIQEFIPYVFQLFAALLEANPSGTLSDYNKTLVTPILIPTLWESKGNAPALVRLLTSIISRGAEGIIQNNQLEPILGIFQKLISTKTHEALSFELIETVITSLPLTALEPYFVTILQLMLTRLSNSKTEVFSQRFITFYHFISAREDKGLGTDFFIKVTDQIQNDVFKPIYLTIILPDTQKLTRPFDRKTAVVSFTKTISDSQAFVDRYPKGWGLTCQKLLQLLINPPVPPTVDVILDQDIDDLSFGVGFTQLNTCKKTPKDPFPEIVDVKKWVGEYLKRADGRHNGRISQFVQERLSSETKQALLAYMQG